MRAAERIGAAFAALALVLMCATLLSRIAATFADVGGRARAIVVAKQIEVRTLGAQLHSNSQSLRLIAPGLALELAALDVKAAIFDAHGRFIAGDRALAPLGALYVKTSRIADAPRQVRFFDIAGDGYVALGQTGSQMFWHSFAHIFGNAWWILLLGTLLAYFVAREGARRLLAPTEDVARGLEALASGGPVRTFVLRDHEQTGGLAASYNAAVERVSASLEERSRTDERMRQFVADAGHELRTPLTVLAGYIAVLQRGAIDERGTAVRILQTMSEEAERLRRLTDRLLALARFDAAPPPRVAPLDVDDLVRDAVDAVRALDFGTPIGEDLASRATVEADEGELRDAVRNVVENAAKYAAGAGVRVSSRAVDGRVRVEVADDGPGMTEQERIHAFDRFFRGEARHHVQGSGLGLAIAKRAVERAGGTIELKSTPGVGTRVLIDLPTRSKQE